MINFMSVVHEQVYPVAGNLARVQELLADRLGRDVFMYSITVTPELDTPKILKAFAARFGAGPGWRFLTGERANIEVVRDRLFAQSFAPPPGCAPTHDCSMGLIRYGNESVGLWGAVPTRTEPEWIVERLSWIQPRQRPTGAPVRRGPRPSTYMS